MFDKIRNGFSVLTQTTSSVVSSIGKIGKSTVKALSPIPNSKTATIAAFVTGEFARRVAIIHAPAMLVRACVWGAAKAVGPTFGKLIGNGVAMAVAPQAVPLIVGGFALGSAGLAAITMNNLQRLAPVPPEFSNEPIKEEDFELVDGHKLEKELNEQEKSIDNNWKFIEETNPVVFNAPIMEDLYSPELDINS